MSQKNEKRRPSRLGSVQSTSKSITATYIESVAHLQSARSERKKHLSLRLMALSTGNQSQQRSKSSDLGLSLSIPPQRCRLMAAAAQQQLLI